jgi:hypothetical protein
LEVGIYRVATRRVATSRVKKTAYTMGDSSGLEARGMEEQTTPREDEGTLRKPGAVKKSHRDGLAFKRTLCFQQNSYVWGQKSKARKPFLLGIEKQYFFPNTCT